MVAVRNDYRYKMPIILLFRDKLFDAVKEVVRLFAVIVNYQRQRFCKVKAEYAHD